MRTRYLLSYDVRDEKRLRRAAKVALAYGYRLQYSVYICDLSDIERTNLERALRRVLNLHEDAAVLVDLGVPGPSSDRRLHWLSTPSKLAETGEAKIV